MQRAAFFPALVAVKYDRGEMQYGAAHRRSTGGLKELWHGLPWNGIFWLSVLCLIAPATFFAVKAELDRARLLGVRQEALAQLDSGDSAEVVLILNGDEFVIEHDELRARVRMLGIKSFDPVVNEREITAYGHASVHFLKQWVLDKEVRLVFDVPKQDEHGRYLAYVYLGEIDINRRMVAEGIAMAYTEFEVARENEYLMAEIQPRRTGVGIWGGTKAATRIAGLRREWANARSERTGRTPADPLLQETP